MVFIQLGRLQLRLQSKRFEALNEKVPIENVFGGNDGIQKANPIDY
jgi:hypothetical protein